MNEMVTDDTANVMLCGVTGRVIAGEAHVSSWRITNATTQGSATVDVGKRSYTRTRSNGWRTQHARAAPAKAGARQAATPKSLESAVRNTSRRACVGASSGWRSADRSTGAARRHSRSASRARGCSAEETADSSK